MARKPKNYINEYRKLRRNILQRVRRAEKRGYVFDETAIPEVKKGFVSLAQVKALRAETPEKTYAKASFLTQNGVLSGTEYRKTERSLSAKKAAKTRSKNKGDYFPDFTDLVYDNIFDAIERVVNTEIIDEVRAAIRSQDGMIQETHFKDIIAKRSNKAAVTMLSALTERIARDGEENVAQTIEDDSEIIFDAINMVFASLNLASGEYEIHLAAFITALIGRPMNQDEASAVEETDSDMEETWESIFHLT